MMYGYCSFGMGAEIIGFGVVWSDLFAFDIFCTGVSREKRVDFYLARTNYILFMRTSCTQTLFLLLYPAPNQGPGTNPNQHHGATQSLGLDLPVTSSPR